MKRGAFAISLLVVVFGVSAIFGGDATSSTSCYSHECSHVVSLSPGALAIAPIIFLICLLGRKDVVPFQVDQTVGIWTRFAAFLIDFVVFVSVIFPFFTLGLLWSEAMWTGEFSWSYSRNFLRPSDWVSWVGLAFLQFIMFVCLRAPPKIGEPTAGQYVMGYMIVPAGSPLDHVKSGYRIWLGLLAFIVWPYTLFHVLRQPGTVYWWDRVSETRAVRTDYV